MADKRSRTTHREGKTIPLEMDDGMFEASDTLIEITSSELIPVEESGDLAKGHSLLYIILPNDTTVRYGPFPKGTQDAPKVMIGRASQCNVQLDYKEVSRQHAEIVFHKGYFWITDLDSRGGSFLKGKTFKKHKITSNCTIELAQSVEIKLRLHNA